MEPIRILATAIAFVLSGLAVAADTGAATAKPTVDTDTLTPPPPDGADCRADGNRIICHTSVIEPDRLSEPLFDLPCGTVYETSTDERRGLRWYDAGSLTIVKRLVFFDLHGTWSLSASGNGPTAKVTVNAVSRDVAFPDPYDQDTWPTVFHGVGFTIEAPGYGVIAHLTHQQGYEPDEGDHGTSSSLQDPAVSSELCAALGS
jgi:hypothetical protein